MVAKNHYGLTGDQWLKAKEIAWDPLHQAFLDKDHESIKDLSASAIRNCRDTCRAYCSFLVCVRGMGPRAGANPANLLNPVLLNLFWKFLATPKDPFCGRGHARDSMRLTCNCISHLICGCMAIGITSDVHPDCTPMAVLNWWKAVAQPRCSMCPLGRRKNMARGDGKTWDKVQEVVKEYMEHVLEQADTIQLDLQDGRRDDYVEEEMACFLKDLQIMCILPLYGELYVVMLPWLLAAAFGLLIYAYAFQTAGIVCPPLRPMCAPTLLQPGSSCTRARCLLDNLECPGNCWEVDEDGYYTLTWRHFKNAGRGLYVGEGQVVKTTPPITGELWQRLFRHWATWSRGYWIDVTPGVEEGVAHTFLDARGEPFLSTDQEGQDGTNLSSWIQPTLKRILADSGMMTAQQLAIFDHFTLQVSRFSYVQMMDNKLKHSHRSDGEIQLAKESIVRCMLSSMQEWDTYANRRDHTGDMEETVLWLREVELLM